MSNTKTINVGADKTGTYWKIGISSVISPTTMALKLWRFDHGLAPVWPGSELQGWLVYETAFGSTLKTYTAYTGLDLAWAPASVVKASTQAFP